MSILANKSRDSASSRLPTRQEVLPVLAVSMFFVFSWALYRMFIYVPSWLVYLNIWDILVLAAYVLSYALFESAFFMGLVLILSLLFPPRFFADRFVVQGSTVVLVISVSAFLLQRKIGIIYNLALWQYTAYPLIFIAFLVVLIVISSYVYKRFDFLARLVYSLAERMMIFFYLYLLLGLMSLVVVIVRNIS